MRSQAEAMDAEQSPRRASAARVGILALFQRLQAAIERLSAASPPGAFRPQPAATNPALERVGEHVELHSSSDDVRQPVGHGVVAQGEAAGLREEEAHKEMREQQRICGQNVLLRGRGLSQVVHEDNEALFLFLPFFSKRRSFFLFIPFFSFFSLSFLLLSLLLRPTNPQLRLQHVEAAGDEMKLFAGQNESSLLDPVEEGGKVSAEARDHADSPSQLQQKLRLRGGQGRVLDVELQGRRRSERDFIEQRVGGERHKEEGGERGRKERARGEKSAEREREEENSTGGSSRGSIPVPLVLSLGRRL